MRALDDVMDAMSDLLVADLVHQAMIGNAERSAAALDALDRPTKPAPGRPKWELDAAAATTGVVRHSLLVLLGNDAPATR